jgi:DNA-binding XRE family transcriptional regulator
MLRSLVVVQHEYDWETLGRAAKVTRQEVIKRWQESIYPQLKVKNKIAGALRWSAVEDSILIEAERKLGEDWDFIVGFLPSRSKFSIEGRWRRLTKNPTLFQQFEYNQGRESEVDRQAMSKYQYRKHVIRQIGAKINP